MVNIVFHQSLFTQDRTCAIIKVECCVYIPDLSGYISATLDDMKGQVRVMSDNNLPFWTSVLSGWRVMVENYLYHCYSCPDRSALWTLYFTMHYELCNQPKGWCRSPKLEVRESGCNISLWMMLILWVKSIERGEWRRKQTEQAPSWKQDSILGRTVDFELYAQHLWKRHTNWKTRPPGWKSRRAHT